MKLGLKTTTFLFLLSFFLLPVLTHAQIPTSIDGILIDQSPKQPSSGEQVKVTLESYSTDLHGASVVWLVDGKKFDQGVGKLFISIPAPALGKTVTVIADILTVEKKQVRKAVIIKSGEVDLIWESGGYIPPTYRGKSFFSYQNPIKIIAMPHLAVSNGAEINPATLLYTWTENDKVIQDQSGYGKQSVSLQLLLPRPLKIEVQVATADGTSKATGSLTIEPGNPSISFYEEDPLYGILYNRALKDKVELDSKEISIRAVPFGFNFSDTKPLSYLWMVNNLERTDLARTPSIILRTKGDSIGSSNISLSVRSDGSILQGADSAVKVIFGRKNATTNTSLFQ